MSKYSRHRVNSYQVKAKSHTLNSITIVSSPVTKRVTEKMNEDFDNTVDDLFYWAVILLPALFAVFSTRR